MTFRREKTIKASRKHHRCAHCGSMIPTGVSHLYVAQFWDGEFHTHRAHHDCAALWSDAFQHYGDWNDGMVLDLGEAIEPDESRDLVQAAYNSYRGYYPHAICRLELRWQRGDINGADRLRAMGVEPHAEDYPPVFG